MDDNFSNNCNTPVFNNSNKKSMLHLKDTMSHSFLTSNTIVKKKLKTKFPVLLSVFKAKYKSESEIFTAAEIYSNAE